MGEVAEGDSAARLVARRGAIAGESESELSSTRSPKPWIGGKWSSVRGKVVESRNPATSVKEGSSNEPLKESSSNAGKPSDVSSDGAEDDVI